MLIHVYAIFPGVDNLMGPGYTLKALLDGDRADLDRAIAGWVILPVANEIIYLNTVCVSIWVIYIVNEAGMIGEKMSRQGNK